MYKDVRLFIDGSWRNGSDGQFEHVYNPANEAVLGKVAHASEEDLADSPSSAQSGFQIWKRASAQERATALSKAADLIADRQKSIATTMTLEQGKPLAESLGEIDRVVETFRFNSEAAAKLGSTNYDPADGAFRQSIAPEPIGVSLGLTAWNFPAILPTRKLGPALAAVRSIWCSASPR